MTHDMLPQTSIGEFEQSPKPTELALLDIDRTLIKTRHLFEAALESMKGNIEALTPELVVGLLKAESDNEGNAFDYIDWLYLYTNDEQLLDPEAIKDMIVAAHCDENGRISDAFIDSIMVDGSLDLFEALEDADIAAILLTAGGTTNQMVKILLLQQIVRQKAEDTGRRFVNLDSYVVVDNSKQRKTELANECTDGAKSFYIGPLLNHASVYGGIDESELSDLESAWVVDDKYRNTTPTESTNVTGILVYIEGDPDRREKDELEDDPRPRIGLRDVAAMLRDRGHSVTSIAIE